MHQTPQCTHPTLSASSFCINYGTDCIYLRDTAVFSRGTPSWPVQKNGVFCNATAPAPPRAGKTVGRRIILSPDMARVTRPCSGKRRNLTQNAHKGYLKATVGNTESYADNSNCRILQKMHGAPHGTHCRMAGNRSTASSRCIPEEITFELAIGYDKQKGPRA